MMSEFRGREGVPEIRTFSDKGEGGGQGNSDIQISKSKFKGKLLQTRYFRMSLILKLYFKFTLVAFLLSCMIYSPNRTIIL